MEKLHKLSRIHRNIKLYLPESFEWIILNAGLIEGKEISEILAQPEKFIESQEYFSWERYFARLLSQKTEGTIYKYHKSKQTFTKSVISDMREIDFWRNNMLIFNSSSLAEIATTLERMYGVKVVFDSEKLKNVLFSGTIRNSSLHNVFYIISLTYPLTYELEGDTVRIGSSIN